jgi:nucleoside-diphosphate-sugar epimerase
MNFLLTGSSGFLGKTVYDRLKLNNKVLSLGRGKSHDFSVNDLIDTSNLAGLKEDINVVVHIAGLAHKNPQKESDKQAFDKVNYEGTRSLCEWIEKWLKKPESFIFISSVSVYGRETGLNISEEEELNGNSSYAFSKVKAEQYLIEWGKKLGIKILILRLPLIIGSNPPGNLGKMILGIKRGTYFSIGGGKAKKSMVLAEDVADLIAGCPDISGIYNLTDGYHPSFSELESIVCSKLKKDKPFNMPIGLAKLLGKIGDFLPLFPVNSDTINKISKDLTFSDLKARQELGWNPSRVIDKFRI